jgi:dTDP-4-amino-4,6-dideoxygalactose transaminase
MKRILFNDVAVSDNYTKNISHLFSDYELFRKKHFSNICLQHLQQTFYNSDLLLTHSATGALEIIATLINIQPGDEIIIPSFTFVSTANAFVSKGAIPVFIDIDADTLNINETLIEQAISPKTKAVVAMHYAGHACNMNALKAICQKHNLILIEDAAMAYGNYYENNPLGSIADFGVISFDITKHISAVQGGLLIINNKAYSSRASTIYHIGTNRDDFSKGLVTNYEWVDVGSKYQMNELNAAILHEHLQNENQIFNHRKTLSKRYTEELKSLEFDSHLQCIPNNQLDNNIHEYYIITNNHQTREQLRNYLNENNIEALVHYNPLHQSKMGNQFKFIGNENAKNISEQILRLPMHNNVLEDDVVQICQLIKSFYHNES